MTTVKMPISRMARQRTLAEMQDDEEVRLGREPFAKNRARGFRDLALLLFGLLALNVACWTGLI